MQQSYSLIRGRLGVFAVLLVAVVAAFGIFGGGSPTVEASGHAPCSPGFYDDGNACVPAEPGSFVAEAGATSATLCPVGTYQDQAGAVACVPAEPGSFVAEAGATSATLCPVGTYQDQAGAVACVPAEPGSFVAEAGATSATLCPVGTYQDQAGAVACVPAEPGSFVAEAGATSATLCPVGTYQDQAGAVACVPAEPGSFVPDAGATSATLCPVGFTSEAGAIECYPIEAEPVGTCPVAWDLGQADEDTERFDANGDRFVCEMEIPGRGRGNSGGGLNHKDNNQPVS